MSSYRTNVISNMHTHFHKNMCFWSSPNISQLSSSGGNDNIKEEEEKRKNPNENFFPCLGEMSWACSAFVQRSSEIADANNRITRKFCRRRCRLCERKSWRASPVCVCVWCGLMSVWVYVGFVCDLMLTLLQNDSKPNFLRLFNISFILLVLVAFFSFLRRFFSLPLFSLLPSSPHFFSFLCFAISFFGYHHLVDSLSLWF